MKNPLLACSIFVITVQATAQVRSKKSTLGKHLIFMKLFN